MQTDSLFYRLFQNWPKIVINLLQLPCEASSYRFVSEEIKQTGFRIDGIFKPIDNHPEQPIIFTEVQYQPDHDFYGRFFSEIILYLYRQKPGRHWLAFVIYPDRQTEKPPSIEFEPLLGLPQITRFYMEDFEHSTEPVYDLLRPIACSPDDTVILAKTLAQESGRLDKDVIEFIETVLVYKLPNLSREEIRIMLGLNDVKLKETRFYQEIAEEERREGERVFLNKLLNKRFGPLPDWTQQKLEQAKVEQLECWGERILDAKTLADVFEPL